MSGSSPILAAGAVLWRRTDAGGVEIAVVHRPRYDDWSLPKGKVDRGETLPFTAVREVAEETGFTARLGAGLGEVHYAVLEGPKTVRYWTAEARGGAFTPNDECDDLRWCTTDEAAALLSYRRDLDVLARFRRTGVPDAVILLVRHAKAGSRSQWDGDDDERPLSSTGHDQARHVARLLALFDPDRISSAPLLRCRDTVAPLADALGLPVTDEPLLSEQGYWDDPEAGLARVREIAATPGVSAVCSQGGVIPDVVGRLTGRADVAAKKASTWVLGLTGGVLRTADLYARPTG
jgi:8-oxo-dGTP pyrophosphatase MutT (NUDIX family)/phosphohistidine phosphatase SixA